MLYLGIAFTAAWVVYFIYLVLLNRQLRSIRRRLDAREK
jgi:CcmD family protein